MASETHPLAAKMPAGEMVGDNQPPPAEMGGETEPPQAEIESEMQPPPLPVCVSKVLDDYNLLAEIIVRVGFPTSLVRAAAVCRRWLLLASDRAFLRRFRKLHPPKLLGFYHAYQCLEDDNFFPMLPQPPPPELAAVMGRASFRFDNYWGTQTNMMGCWNGRVVTMLLVHLCPMTYGGVTYGEHRMEITFVVHNPLCSQRGMAILPKLDLTFKGGSMYSYENLFFFKEEGNVLSYFFVRIESARDETKSKLHVSMLENGDGAWHTHLTLTVDYLIHARPNLTTILVDNKIYMASDWNEIVVMDLTDSSISTIQLPQGVDFLTTGTTMLSRADDTSAVYLIHAKELQLHIWLHKGGNWLLVDNICLREMCAPFLEAEPTAILQINHVGDYTAEFLFLEMGRFALYLDVKCRTLRKLYELETEDLRFGHPCIYPFMMIWPPTFPALQDGPQEQGQEEV
uniref:Uncharacterized protein n=1 Tax=Avena sativa TaxID=4498 RepID=A0ACD5XK11_AVESA